MLFSVIVPCFNSETYLRNCLNSILAQTMSDFEIVAINDGSTDGTAQILDEYAAKTTAFTFTILAIVVLLLLVKRLWLPLTVSMLFSWIQTTLSTQISWVNLEMLFWPTKLLTLFGIRLIWLMMLSIRIMIDTISRKTCSRRLLALRLSKCGLPRARNMPYIGCSHLRLLFFLRLESFLFLGAMRTWLWFRFWWRILKKLLLLTMLVIITLVIIPRVLQMFRILLLISSVRSIFMRLTVLPFLILWNWNMSPVLTFLFSSRIIDGAFMESLNRSSGTQTSVWTLVSVTRLRAPLHYFAEELLVFII